MAGQTKRTSRRKPSGFPSIFIFPLQNVPGYVYLCSSVPRHRPSAASDLKKKFFLLSTSFFFAFFSFPSPFFIQSVPIFLFVRFFFGCYFWFDRLHWLIGPQWKGGAGSDKPKLPSLASDSPRISSILASIARQVQTSRETILGQ